MKVLFDYQIFSFQKYGGVSKYFVEIMNSLPKEVFELNLILSNNEYLKDAKFAHYQEFFPRNNFRGKNWIMSMINQAHSLRTLKKASYDVLHQTNFDPYFFKAVRNKPVVTTFHDINVLVGTSDKYIKNQLECLNKSNHIIAISHNTKKDLLKRIDLDEKKITVIHHGVNEAIKPQFIGDRIINEDYILFVGRREEEFKNFNRLLAVFAILITKKSHQYLKLVCTGTKFSTSEIENIKSHKLLDNVIHISATELEMANLYTFAKLFVYPSLYEGFGMPILEAMSYNCLCVLANASCFPEIAGDAALYFEPTDKDHMLETIIYALENEEVKNNLIEKGKLLIRKKTWQKSANKHLEVYKSILT